MSNSAGTWVSKTTSRSSCHPSRKKAFISCAEGTTEASSIAPDTGVASKTVVRKMMVLQGHRKAVLVQGVGVVGVLHSINQLTKLCNEDIL